MSISLTQRAAERVSRFMATDPTGVGLRLGVKRMGCSGWGYEVELADAVNDDDAVFEDHGVKVIVDPVALPLVAGTEIDFVTEGLNRVFKFNNPNAEEECGCGESFTVVAAD